MPSQEKIFNTRGEADFERPRVGTSEGGEGIFGIKQGGDQTPKDTMLYQLPRCLARNLARFRD